MGIIPFFEYIRAFKHTFATIIQNLGKQLM